MMDHVWRKVRAISEFFRIPTFSDIPQHSDMYTRKCSWWSSSAVGWVRNPWGTDFVARRSGRCAYIIIGLLSLLPLLCSACSTEAGTRKQHVVFISTNPLHRYIHCYAKAVLPGLFWFVGEPDEFHRFHQTSESALYAGHQRFHFPLFRTTVSQIWENLCSAPRYS